MGEVRPTLIGIANPFLKLALVRSEELIVAMVENHEHA
jgi:hypothetical protein